MNARLKELTKLTGRSEGQTKELFRLCDYNFQKLKDLELKVKQLHLSYCPNSKEEVEKLLSTEVKNPWLTTLEPTLMDRVSDYFLNKKTLVKDEVDELQTECVKQREYQLSFVLGRVSKLLDKKK
jgi:hypothetical protein